PPSVTSPPAPARGTGPGNVVGPQGGPGVGGHDPFSVVTISPGTDNPKGGSAVPGTTSGGSATIPASVFLGLGNRLLSAIPGPGRSGSAPGLDVFERVFAEGPPLSLPGEFLRLAILTKIPDCVGGDEFEGPGPTGPTPATEPSWLWGPGGLLGLGGKRPVVRSAAATRPPAVGAADPADLREDEESDPT